ncbi:DUF4334 domain-containing protein [Flavobacterium sp. JAS]|uniref:DUF4334 domain-containing protein n=1 Tax=Flavobacterium sp. JAS TaxID=2897329 RepID=UPI001E48FAC1|nr:DUF4334 domain-containing protein [Flavobacterium sp. JAS]MCD0472540.1 DUF4334 domain-containing protein [Flavobacterium sp. JAS]
METLNQVLQTGKTTTENAFRIFDELEPATIELLIGHWKGYSLNTDHPQDGSLEAAGWYGKIFEDAQNVSPLVFYTSYGTDTFFADPVKLAKLAADYPSVQGKVGDFREEIETTEYKAHLRMTQYRDKISATMIYDNLPINDIFKKIDEDTLLGVMDAKGDPNSFFFILVRDDI